jgi:hypothetical protein
MGIGNAWKYRPERQARLQADMQNPEYMRRRQIWEKARGKILGHFGKKDLAARWNREWNLLGRPADHPDFPEWLEQKRPSLKAERDANRAKQQELNRFHAEWVASGMPGVQRP